MENRPEWMSDSEAAGIEEYKLRFLNELAEGCRGKNRKELMAFLAARMKQAKNEGITFSSSEAGILIQAIRQHSSPDELNQIDELMKKAPFH